MLSLVTHSFVGFLIGQAFHDNFQTWVLLTTCRFSATVVLGERIDNSFEMTNKQQRLNCKISNSWTEKSEFYPSLLYFLDRVARCTVEASQGQGWMRDGRLGKQSLEPTRLTQSTTRYSPNCTQGQLSRPDWSLWVWQLWIWCEEHFSRPLSHAQHVKGAPASFTQPEQPGKIRNGLRGKGP